MAVSGQLGRCQVAYAHVVMCQREPLYGGGGLVGRQAVACCWARAAGHWQGAGPEFRPRIGYACMLRHGPGR